VFAPQSPAPRPGLRLPGLAIGHLVEDADETRNFGEDGGIDYLMARRESFPHLRHPGGAKCGEELFWNCRLEVQPVVQRPF
jgi:hypothetical protein